MRELLAQEGQMKQVDDLSYYEILEVNPSADYTEIHMAYIKTREALKSQSMAHYSAMSEDEKEKLRLKIEMAYQTLVDQEKRNE